MGMAKRIKERRTALGLTQEELATKLGLQKSAIAKYENGRVENIKRSVIQKMAEILECSPAYLMGWDESAADQQTPYYYDEETAKAAQEIFENKELRMLFDATRDADAEDLRALHSMALALKRKERGSND